MMKKTVPSLLRGLAFLLAACMLLGLADLILSRRTVTGPWDYTRMVGGFFRNEPEDTYDILAFGSSHMYCSLDPMALWKQTGLRSYLLATQQQPLALTAHYVEMALEKQSPKVIILECFMLGRSEEAMKDPGVLHDGLDPLPLSAGKLQAIHALLPWRDRAEYVLPLIKYHSRWTEADSSFFDLSWLDDRDIDRGFVDLDGVKTSYCRQRDYADIQPEQLSDADLKALARIQAAAREAGCTLVLMMSPYSEAWGDLPRLAALRDYAAREQLPLLEFNGVFDSLGLDNEGDFVDPGHLNRTGAGKLTARVGQYLTEELGLAPTDASPEEQARWEADYITKGY